MTYSTHLPRAIWLTCGLSFAVLTLDGEAAAQFDPGEQPKKAPNVLLIVDTSGSMEYEAGLETFPTCDPTGAVTSERSRWLDLVEVMSGTINNYRCQSIDRASSTFTSLYRLPPGASGTLNPADYDYRNPYHRPLSGTCAPIPNTAALDAATNAFAFVGPAFALYNAAATSCASFTQSPDGLIDSFGTDIRFGLMTFDTLPDANDGYNNGTSTSEFSNGIAGAWSYFVGPTSAGRPAICDDPPDPMEVGARNGAAPAWEGKLIPFGLPTAGLTENNVRHSRVEQVLLSTRPYGATPIAGALTDAQTFLTSDLTLDPTPTTDILHSYAPVGYGPATDPYVQNGCRDQFVILLTDGEPNLDLRPFCEGPRAADCPFDRPETITSELKGIPTPKSIKTFVVGFADETPPAPEDSVNCKTMTAADWAPGGRCDSAATSELRVCCALHEIADAGGTGHAYFGNDKTALRTELSNVFNQILASGGNATQPVRSPGAGDADGSGAVAFRILTSYEPGDTGVWRGTVERVRWTCPMGILTEAKKDPTVGDDFSFNVNSHPTARTFVTYVPADTSGVRYSEYSIRPNVSSANDGIGTNAGGAVVAGDPTAFTTNLPAAALRPDLTSGPCAGLTAANCKALLVPWFVGGDNGTSNRRCATPAPNQFDPDCSVIGDVMHSTPIIVDRPTAEIEDERYLDFRFAKPAANRPMMVYTSSNDGVLHGFKLSPNVAADPEVDNSNSNEVFAFVPPANLTLIDSQYPKSRQKVLDGIPVVQDVVATTDTSNTYYGYRLERTRDDASGAATTLTYRTVLVQSFGGSQAGYFAVDITEPQKDPLNKEGPRLLWQLTTDAAGLPLFGEKAATPLITTLRVGTTEVAVAVLPGGAATPTSSVCARKLTTYPQIPTGYAPRYNVRCYQLDANNNNVADSGDVTTNIGARSLTIVRLDSGEVLMRFRRSSSERPTMDATKQNVALLDSPITGAPAAYPVGPGAVSDRIFVGDQDGGMWRIDTSSTTPANWTMTLFFDTYSKHPGVGVPSEAGPAGRPILVAPTLSVTEFGEITVATATGDQDLSGTSGEEQYIWSLRETFNSTDGRFDTAVNWYRQLENGEHVLGPMRLNEGILYFSTFARGGAVACSDGLSTIYAVDYLRPATPDPSGGGEPRLSLLNPALVHALPDRITTTEMKLPVGTIIFGVNLDYAPTCFAEGSLAAAMLGGSHATASGASAANLELSFQTSTTKTGKEPLGFKTGFETIGLNRPSSGATMESWAAILE